MGRETSIDSAFVSAQYKCYLPESVGFTDNFQGLTGLQKQVVIRNVESY